MNDNDEQWLALRQRLKEDDFLWLRIVKLIEDHGTPEMVKQTLLTAGVSAAEVDEIMRTGKNVRAFLDRYAAPEARDAVLRAVGLIWGEEVQAYVKKQKIKPRTKVPT